MMIFILITAVLLVLGASGRSRLCSMRVEGLLPREKTACINGLFIIFVFVSHAMQYVPKSTLSLLDNFYLVTIGRLGQLIVTTFLFYSGYGIMESISKKDGYVDCMPLSRIGPFVLDVAIALIPFAIIRCVNGEPPTLNELLLSVVGRKSLGNSDWYIFAILAMWVATWVSFKITRTPRNGLALVFFQTIIYALILWADSPETTRCYNTIFCYPMGMLFSLYLKKSGEKLGIRRLLLLLCVCLAVFAISYVIREPYIIVYNARGVAFALSITLIVMNINHVSTLLVWAGRNLFYIYIYQRFFMILFSPLVTLGTIPFMICVTSALLLWCISISRVHQRIRGMLFG